MKNVLVSSLLAGATYLRGTADNSQLEKNDMLLCSTALLFIATPRNLSKFTKAPPKKQKIFKSWTWLV